MIRIDPVLENNMINGYKPRKQPESVKDCLSFMHGDQTDKDPISGPSIHAKSQTSVAELQKEKVVEQPINILGQQIISLYSGSSKGGKSLNQKLNDVGDLSGENLTLQRTRAEVFLLDKGAA
jgi:hypothetical protein